MLYVYLGAAVFYLASIIGAGWLGYSTGTDVERAAWQEEFISQQKKFDIELEAAMNRVNEQNKRNQNKLIEVINETEQRNQKLESDIATISSQRLYVSTKKPNCEGSVPGQAASTGKPGGGTNRVELSDEITANIRKDYFDAQRVVNQYQACREMLMQLADVEE